MGIVSPGFQGRPRSAEPALPPGQYLTEDFPVLSAGPTPRVPLDTWEFVITTETGAEYRWSWHELMALPQETPTVDLHCVTRWSKLGTNWQGVSLDTLLDGVDTAAHYALAHSYGGYTTNLPLDDLRGGRAWVAHTYDGAPAARRARRPGPAAGAAPVLLEVRQVGARHPAQDEDEPGFWETAGYHDYGDPWREQRYQGD